MKKKRRVERTAAEIIEELKNNKEFVARSEERERQRVAEELRSRKEQTPMLSDLRNAGINIDCVWDLVNTDEPYPAAIPILAAHLQRPYDPKIREGIARALTVKASKCIFDILLSEFEKEEDRTTFGVKWALANAIRLVLDGTHADRILPIVQDEQLGLSRGPLIEALSNIHDPRVKSVLSELVNDAELGEDARRALTRYDMKNKSRRNKR